MKESIICFRYFLCTIRNYFTENSFLMVNPHNFFCKSVVLDDKPKIVVESAFNVYCPFEVVFAVFFFLIARYCT